MEMNPGLNYCPPPKDIEDIPEDDSDDTVLLRRLITIWYV